MQITILITLCLFFLIWRIYRAKIKGVIGEKTTSVILSFLDKKKYKVINNVVLKSDAYVAQIDHLVISDYGIFVIETKNYKGWILGGEKSEYWTQVIFKRKEKLYNPIRQNLGHIKALKACLADFPNISYISIIVFSSKATIKVNTTTDVVYSSRLLKTIRKYTEVNLSETNKINIYEKINASNLIDTYDKKEHIKSIEQRIRKRERVVSANKCQKCAGELVRRKGQYGEFLGCSNYPKCKNTIKLK